MKARANSIAAAPRAWLRTLVIFSGGVLLAGVALSDATQSAAQSAAQATPATWQKHQYSFAYLGFTSTYSCDGLADKLKQLLLAAGARPDAKSQPGACASGFGRPDKFARADLTFYTLGTAPTPDPSSKAVEGTWRTVALSDRSPRELRVGDCELVEQFRNQVLPMFTTRNVEDHTTCVPYQESGSEISLTFDSLVAPLPAPRTAAAR